MHTVGIDRVLERAGVAKAWLYGTFGNKEELVRAYLEQRARRRQERITSRIAQYDDPRNRCEPMWIVRLALRRCSSRTPAP